MKWYLGFLCTQEIFYPPVSPDHYLEDWLSKRQYHTLEFYLASHLLMSQLNVKLIFTSKLWRCFATLIVIAANWYIRNAEGWRRGNVLARKLHQAAFQGLSPFHCAAEFPYCFYVLILSFSVTFVFYIGTKRVTDSNIFVMFWSKDAGMGNVGISFFVLLCGNLMQSQFSHASVTYTQNQDNISLLPAILFLHFTATKEHSELLGKGALYIYIYIGGLIPLIQKRENLLLV